MISYSASEKRAMMERMLLQHARTILGNMAQENPLRRWYQLWKPRWSISDEPLRADAKALLVEINAFYAAEQNRLSAIDERPSSQA
jgi:hypothetical protein